MKQRVFEYFEFVFFGIILIPVAIVYFIFTLPFAIANWVYWELYYLLGYGKWENFEKVIQKAKDACKNAGEEVDYHFPDVRKMIALGKGAKEK